VWTDAMGDGSPVVRKDLEEEPSPGRSGSPRPAMVTGAHQTRRRSKASKPTLPILPPRRARNRQRDRAERGGDRSQRQGCNGRGDAERLSAGSSSRGTDLRRGKARASPIFGSVRTRRKHGGPQDRQRDATSPRFQERRKPPKWCETTRAEQDFGGGTPGAEATTGRRRGSGRYWSMSVEGRQAHRSARVPSRAGVNPREGRFRPGRSVWLRSGAQARGSRGPSFGRVRADGRRNTSRTTRQRARSRRERERPTTRYVDRTGRSCTSKGEHGPRTGEPCQPHGSCARGYA